MCVYILSFHGNQRITSASEAHEATEQKRKVWIATIRSGGKTLKEESHTRTCVQAQKKKKEE